MQVQRGWPDAQVARRFRRPLAWPEARPSVRLGHAEVRDLWQLAEGVLYVSSTPSERAYRSLFIDGIRAVVNLDAASGTVISLRGINPRYRLYCTVVGARRAPGSAQAEGFLRALGDPNNLPVLVHGGRDLSSSATLAALARHSVDGWSMERALLEARQHAGRPGLSAGQAAFLRQWAALNRPGAFRPPSDPSAWGGLRFDGDPPQRAEMIELCRRFPEVVQRVPVLVCLVPPGELGVREAIACYEPGEVLIINDHYDGRVFCHEYGHAAWFEVMTAAQQDDWERYWSANLPRMPRDYARKNREEGFADCFALAYGAKRRPEYAPLCAKVRSYFPEPTPVRPAFELRVRVAIRA